jgi:trigger factor
MKVTQEKLPDSQIGLEIEIPAEISQKIYNTTLQSFARTANIPGFRKGKVPRPILLQRLGSNLTAATLEDSIKSTLGDAIEQEKIDSLGNYRLKSSFEELLQNFVPGQPFTFSAIIEVPPTIEVGDYGALTIQAEEVPYNPEEVEDWFKEQQGKQATLIPVEERAADWGDVAIIDYQAYEVSAEGETEDAIAEMVDSDFKVDLEKGNLVEGMVEGIVGMKPEETKAVTVTFPQDYPLEQVAGQPVRFDITLKELKTKELPELDDDFADEVSEYETLAELRASLEENYRKKAADSTENNVNTAIVNELVKISEVDLPDSLVQEEITQVLTETLSRLEQMGLDPRSIFTAELVPKLRENARPEAVQRLQQILIIKKIAQTESIEPEASEIRERVNTIKARFANESLDLEKLKAIVTEEIIAEKTMAVLREKVTVELVPLGTLTPPEEDDEDENTIEAEVVEASEAEIVETPSEA